MLFLAYTEHDASHHVQALSQSLGSFALSVTLSKNSAFTHLSGFFFTERTNFYMSGTA